MRKLLLFALMVSTVSGLGQGTVDFINRFPYYSINAAISFSPGGPAPAGLVDGGLAVPMGEYVWGGVNARAGLYGGPIGSSEDELVLLNPNPAVGFRSGYAAGIVDTLPDSSRFVPGVPAGSAGVFQVRAWDVGLAGVGSYENAFAIAQNRSVYLGKSELVVVDWLGGENQFGPPWVPSPLVGLQPFSLSFVSGEYIAPEPSSFVLTILGVFAGLAFWRRSK